jgi:3-hydroxyacyl-CoA dehydrogenase
MSIEKVGVIGAGTMGASIALAIAAKGYAVQLVDSDTESLKRGLAKIDSGLEKLIKRGLAPKEAERQRNKIASKTSLSELSGVDLVIEAVTEELSVKQDVFRKLDRLCPDNCILASNTSSMSIAQLASFTDRADRVIGMHFFNPAHVMKLVEVVPGICTSEKTVRRAIEFGVSLGKLAIKVDDCTSFLVNRLLARYTTEALWVLEEGRASVEEIDEAVVSFLMPIGPFALRDMNGLDVGLSVATSNYQAYGERFKVPPLLGEMVNKKMLGKKSLVGFYRYDPSSGKSIGVNSDVSLIAAWSRKQNKKVISAEQEIRQFTPMQLFLPMINEAFLALQERIVAPLELDLALKAGLGMRKGPLEFAFDLGLSNCLEQIRRYFINYGERFRPAPLLERYVWAGKTTID